MQQLRVDGGMATVLRTWGKVLHYYTEPWDDAGDRTPAPLVIIILDLQTGREESFGIYLEAELQGIRTARQFQRCRNDLELAMLERFYESLRASPSAWLVGWNI